MLKIKVEINNTELELTVEEAEKLYNDLSKIFGNKSGPVRIPHIPLEPNKTNNPNKSNPWTIPDVYCTSCSNER